MSGFGSFGSGTPGGGVFGSKPPNQGTGGFTMPTTTTVTTSTFTFGMQTASPSGTGLFGSQQQASGFGTTFGAKTTTAGTRFGFGVSTGSTGTPAFGVQPSNNIPFGVPATTTAPTFGVSTSTTAPTFQLATSSATPTFGIPTSSTAPTFGAPSSTTAPTFGVPGSTTVPTFGVSTTTTAPTFGVTTSTNALTFGVTTTTTAPTFGVTTTTTTAPTFGVSTSTGAPTFGAPATTQSTFGSFNTSAGFTFGTPSTSSTPAKTTTGFTSNAAGTPGFNFNVTTSTTTPLSFNVQTTTAAGTTTTITTTSGTLSFGVSGLPTTTATTQATGFSLSQPTTTTASLTFGAPKTTGSFTFGITTSTSLGTGLLSTTKTGETSSGTTTTTTTTVGLGGVDNKQSTQGLSGRGTLEPKQAKDNVLPDPIMQTLNEFQNFTKQQKSISVEISHGSSKPLKKVQEDTEAMESLLTTITSGLARNAIAVDKLKTETAQGLHQAEMAQRNHETPPGLEYDNSAPSDYFNDLVTKFETDTVRLRVQVEASEKHLKSLMQSSTISPQELTLAMRRLHETLIVLAARVQALHMSVQSQKEQFKNLRRVYFKDDTNIFENDTDQNFIKKQTIYSMRSLTGPTPFSENPSAGPSLHVDGLAMLASSAGASIPATSSNPSWMSPLQNTANMPSLLPSTNLLGGFQPLELPGFQLSKPPTGNKRSRR